MSLSVLIKKKIRRRRTTVMGNGTPNPCLLGTGYNHNANQMQILYKNLQVGWDDVIPRFSLNKSITYPQQYLKVKTPVWLHKAIGNSDLKVRTPGWLHKEIGNSDFP